MLCCVVSWQVLDAAYDADKALEGAEPYVLCIEVQDVPGVLNQVRRTGGGTRVVHVLAGVYQLPVGGAQMRALACVLCSTRFSQLPVLS